MENEKYKGFSILLNRELFGWFKTKKWIVVLGIVTFLSNIPIILIPSNDGGGFFFSLFIGIYTTFGAIILANNGLVGEKKAGVTAWILSQPVTRKAYLMSKLLGNQVGLSIVAAIIPCVIYYIQLLVWGITIPLLTFFLIILIFILNILFYLALTLFLGSYFSSTNPILSLSFGIFAIQNLMGMIPGVTYFLPYYMVMSGGSTDSLVASMLAGNIIDFLSVLPLIATSIYCIVFVILAFRRFETEEL